MPERGKPVEVAPGVLRLVANNPTPMTYHGTNTYLIEGKGGVYVLDPGPANDEAHAKAIIEAVGVRAAGIIVSHHHSDHFGLVPYLQQVLNVRVFASASFADDTFRPDVALQDGDEVTGLQVLHTPGHASDHLCLGRDDGVLFTGDHVMTWNSSIVIPPDGNMGSYCAQLERLATRDDKLYLPGHGPPLADPIPYAHELLANRRRRELAIVRVLGRGPSSVVELASALYRKSDPTIIWAAQRNVEAHLFKLRHEGVVSEAADNQWVLRT